MVLFSVGDRVKAIKHAHLPPTLTVGDSYLVTAAVPDAGVITLEGFPSTKTFPDHWFELDTTPEEAYNIP